MRTFSIDTPQSLARFIRLACPALQPALEARDTIQAALILRGWVSSTLCMSTAELTFTPGDPVAAFWMFRTFGGGVWADGAARFFASVLNLFGIPAAVYTYGNPALKLEHSTTILCDVHAPGHPLYLMDAYLNYHYTDAATARMLPFGEMIERIRAGRTEDILTAAGESQRPYLTRPGDEVQNLWLYDSRDRMLAHRDTSHPGVWVYQNAKCSLARLLRSGLLREILECCRGPLTIERYMLSLLLETPRLTDPDGTILDRLPPGLSAAAVPAPAADNWLAFFKNWLDALARAGRRIRCGEHTPCSLFTLVKTARGYRPDDILVLGCRSGLALRALQLGRGQAQVTCVARDYTGLEKSRSAVPFNPAGVRLVKSPPASLDFSRILSPARRTLIYIGADAARDPALMRRLTENVFPRLTPGSLVLFSGLWHSRETLDESCAPAFLETLVAEQLDPAECLKGFFAPYWKGGSFLGRESVPALMEWVNRHHLSLIFDHGEHHALLVWEGTLDRQAAQLFEIERFNLSVGAMEYNPAARIPYRTGLANAEPEPPPPAARWTAAGEELYAMRRYTLARHAFTRARESGGGTQILVGLAFCEIGLGADLSGAARLLEDALRLDPANQHVRKTLDNLTREPAPCPR